MHGFQININKHQQDSYFHLDTYILKGDVH